MYTNQTQIQNYGDQHFDYVLGHVEYLDIHV